MTTRSPSRPPSEQLAALDRVAGVPAFADRLAEAGHRALRPAPLMVFQINLGKLCNMSCRHCHVDAGPHRVDENMDRATVDACLALLDRTTARTVDLTGGAPELNPNFRYLVDACVERGKHVIDRCNLSVLLLPRSCDLPGFFAERGVEVVASLPHWRRPNTDAQRGDGAWERSIEALRVLNAVGYGRGDPRRRLTLMHNPAGAFLPAAQGALEREWKDGLARTTGVAFDRLIALTNMPISRYLGWLEETDNLDDYLNRLAGAFNPAAIDGVMCRDTLSVGWDGTVYDCDFNQMLELPCEVPRPNVRDLDPTALADRTLRTARHCFGCTAGAGSSCGGATTP